jgi:hypothetical protein
MIVTSARREPALKIRPQATRNILGVPSPTPSGPFDPGPGRFRDPARSTDPESQLPPVVARVLAFLAIFVGGAAGGMIGYAFSDLGGFDGAAAGAVTLISAVLGAGGVAVVAVLTLRALGEWETIRRRQDHSDAPRPRS